MTLKRSVTLNAYTKLKAVLAPMFANGTKSLAASIVINMIIALMNVNVVNLTNDVGSTDLDRRRGGGTMGSFGFAGNVVMTLLTKFVDTYFDVKLNFKRGLYFTRDTSVFGALPTALVIARNNFVAGTICYFCRGSEGGD